jgi:exosortase/archaeosortase family protein
MPSENAKPLVSTVTSESNLRTQVSLQTGSLTVSQFSFLTLLIALGAIAADQVAAPALYSSSPLWAVVVCLGLVCRRGGVRFGGNAAPKHPGLSLDQESAAKSFHFSSARIALFVAAHVLLVSVTRFLDASLQPIGGTFSVAGWMMAALKVSVLLPTLLLLPLKQWRILARVYAAEGIAALVVLFTFFPGRILASVWPWYGQVLGKFVFLLSGFFVHGLNYASNLNPTIQGPSLDVNILFSCSGISGIELFDYLFAFVALLDWNRLRKGRLLVAYFAGILAMLVGNAFRIASFVIFGNHGFADSVVRFHLSAGWAFFAVVFLLYLSLTYRGLLRPSGPAEIR